MKADFTPSFAEENLIWNLGTHHVIGVDEVGRGAFAGPVVVAGVIFHPQCYQYYHNLHHELYEMLHTIHDSKLLLPVAREKLAPLIKAHCLHYEISEISLSVINDIGIGKATMKGMRLVISALQKKIAPLLPFVLVDGFLVEDGIFEQKALVKGDQKSISIAAASIIAKVYRDARMQELSQLYPQYYLDKNKGYGTKDHRDAIREHGLSDIHRASFNLLKFL